MMRAACFAAFAAAVLSFAPVAAADPVRIVIAAGHRFGAPEERPLRYARDDAARVVDVFTSIGGVRPTEAILVDEPNASALADALERARVIAAVHKPEEVSFVFYFSGHGDRARLHLAGETVALDDLAARVARVPAALRIVVLDACRTDDTLRAKGMREEPAFAVALEGSAAGASTGTVWIQASAEGDPAQESQELAGGVFTHYWLSGLRGAADADGDRRVTLAESYDYAYHQTLFKTARASGVLQRPTARIDLREAGPIVLTTPSPASARLLLPQVADTQFLVYEPRSRHVLAEAWSSPDRAVALALPPGAYLLQRRASGRGAAAEVSLARGEERAIAPSDFHDVALETLARKGGAIELTPNELEAAYAPAAQSVVGFVQRAAIRYQRRFDGWALGAAIDGAAGATTTAAEHVRELTGGGSLVVEWREELGSALTLRAGIGPRAEWTQQDLERTDAERALAASYSARETKHALGVGGVAGVRLAWTIAKPTYLTLGAQGTTVLAPATTGTAVRWTIGGDVGAGVAF